MEKQSMELTADGPLLLSPSLFTKGHPESITRVQFISKCTLFVRTLKIEEQSLLFARLSPKDQLPGKRSKNGDEKDVGWKKINLEGGELRW